MPLRKPAYLTVQHRRELPGLETAFREKARRLTTPMAGNFDPARWKQAFGAAADTMPQDRTLLDAALWIGREVKALNQSSGPLFADLCAEQAIALGVASTNREYWISGDSTVREAKCLPEQSLASFDYLANLRYENSYGQRMSAADFVETAVEALQSWIYDARRTCRADPPGEDEDLWGLADKAMQHYTLRRVLKGLFDKALHLGTELDQDGEHWKSRERWLDELHKAWQSRAESNMMDEPQLLAIQWQTMTPSQRRAQALSRSVGEVKWTTKGWTGKVRRKEYLSKRPRGYPLEKRAVQSSYLGLFLKEKFPLAPGLTVSLVLDAWWVIADFTNEIEKSARAAGMNGKLTLMQAAFATTEGELTQILASALKISSKQASEIIAFLSFRDGGASGSIARGAEGKGNRGLWSAPLVPCRDGSLLIPQAVFHIGNPIYRVEAWLERGGIDDTALDHRGDRYEAKCRAELVAALQQNSDLPGAHIAPHGIARSEAFSHQIDLLFQIGNRAFVGEIKCWLTPADPHHWDRFYRVRLPNAVNQALTKAKALENDREVLAGALGISRELAETLEISPIVVLNLSAGFSLTSLGCRIVDADFLCSFLRSPQMTSDITMHYSKPVIQRIVKLYKNEQDAADRFDSVMADPWSLRRFIDRLERSDISYPRPSGGTFKVESLFRGNLTMEEKTHHASLLDLIRDSGQAD